MTHDVARAVSAIKGCAKSKDKSFIISMMKVVKIEMSEEQEP
jgi:hypothetical protein